MEVNYYFIGLVLFILILSQMIKPSKVNRFIGYRSPYSMKNQDTWDFANTLSRKYALVFTISCIVFHIVASFFVSGEPLLFVSLIFLVISLLNIVVFTEIGLRAQFDVNGNQKIN